MAKLFTVYNKEKYGLQTNKIWFTNKKKTNTLFNLSQIQ